MKRIVLYTCLPFAAFILVMGKGIAQDGRSQERGEIRDTEFIIRKDRVLSLPQQQRVFERPPSLPEVSSEGSYTYQVKDFFLDLRPVELDVQPYVRNFPKPTPETYHSFTKLGYGNYQSPLAEIYINNLQDQDRNFGVKLKHQGFYEGPVDGANSAEDHTEVRVNGSLFRDNIEIFGDLGYIRDRYNFYGYSANPVLEGTDFDLEQNFNTVEGDVGIRNLDRLDVFDFDATVGLRLFNDNYLAREHEARVKANVGFRANENLHGGIRSELYFTSPSDSTYTDINRNFFRLQPYAAYIKDGWDIKVGANVIHENDIVPNKTDDFHIFPLAKIAYYFMPSIGVFANYVGDVQRNTYYGFIRENPFLGPSAQLRNTIQNYKIDAGIKGAIDGELAYEVGISYGNFTNMHFYGNHQFDSTRFELIYDDMTRVINLHAAVNWSFDNWYQLDAKADFYQFTLEDIESHWQMPEWEIKLFNTFKPMEQLRIQANAHVMGGIPVLNLESGTTDVLNPIFDLQAKVDYSVSPRFSIFAIGNNLLNQSYQRFWNYPVRGIQGIGGVTFKF
ncbi:TonB-dependent receptor [Pleomorphovibrio marinus]|uniref:TonB-dependent receptor n=1 Tax=Pleomorphovibrio marinus TaxID=2164132 RepID=UPI001E29CF27|nr:TonB-dependent receptor [Pleomorphovibrio marinus]